MKFVLSVKLYLEVLFYVVEAGEQSKSLQAAGQIYEFLIKHAVCRTDVMITLGGGVIGDLGGFAAATFLSGIALIQIPTSLLAQMDSSVGGKTAVNHNKIKNVIGAFHQPVLVYINYSVLKTLPMEELKNGLVEIIVHAIIKDEILFHYIEDNLERILELDEGVMEELIYRNCRIKAEVVQRDEKDLGERENLNFGHTFGHEIESACDYKFRHGECVAIGIIGACYIAERLHFITSHETERIIRLIERLSVLPSIHDCDKEKVLAFIKHDKKAVDDKVKFILPRQIGMVEKYDIDNMQIVQEVLEELMEIKGG